MSPRETADLTRFMTESGDIADLSSVPGTSVDKHSTGGVGDKISLILAPLVASFGLVVPMMSGRGLGHTGGTLDKLESIPGFNCDLAMDEFLDVLRDIGVAMISPAGDMAPVDKRVYALRDVTSTVRAIPLQTASIMCKKLAENPESLVLDVKFGSGAFNPNPEESIELAKSMVEAGEGSGKQTTAFITSMDEPIGKAVGNWFEVVESVETLRGEGPKDLEDLVVVQGGQMLLQGGVCGSLNEGIAMARENLRNGKALEKFWQMVERQGGDVDVVKGVKEYPKAKFREEVRASKAGVVGKIDALQVGLAGVHLGAGRKYIEDKVDFTAGILLGKKVGDRVEEGDLLAECFGNDEKVMKESGRRVGEAFQFGEMREGGDLIRYIVRGGGEVEEFDQSLLK